MSPVFAVFVIIAAVAPIHKHVPPAGHPAVAEAGAEEDAENLEALLDSAIELKDDAAILEAARLLLARQPNNSDALEAAVEASIRGKDAAGARQFAQRYVEAWPDKAQSHLSFADACALRLPNESKQQAAALIAEHLAAARRLSVKPGEFDRGEDLAEAYSTSRQFHLARQEYLDLAASPTLSEASRKEALDHADEIADSSERHALITFTSLWENEGTLLGLDSDVYMGMRGGWLLGVHSHEDWLESRQSGRRQFGGDERQDVAVSGRYVFSPGWQVDALAGAALTHETNMMGGLTLKKTTSGESIYKLILEGNERAVDSMQLIRDGGRQDRAAVEAEIHLSKRIDVQAMGLIRRVDSDLGSVGWGAASNVIVEWHPLKQREDLSLGYEWECSQFYFDGPFSETPTKKLKRRFAQPEPGGPVELVRAQTNTHLAVVEYKRVFGKFSVDLRVAGGWAFVQDRKEWDPSLTLSYRLSRNSKLSLVYEYNSADGMQVSSGDAHSLSLALRVVF